MVKEIKMFEASNGTTHRTMLEALKADLAAALVSDGSINPAQADKMTARIVDDCELRDMIKAIGAHVPREMSVDEHGSVGR